MKYKNYFRDSIAAMDGYVPGEQPQIASIIKLNTNENPYPPSPKVTELLATFNTANLRRYPNARADKLRKTVATLNNVEKENVIIGNGSDDVLTMIFRAFTDKTRPLAYLNPSYTLYRDLAAMQESPVITVDLDKHTFAMPENLQEQIKTANLLMIARPNAPTGNTFDRTKMEDICREFDGIVVFDEAYADFADDNCMEFAVKYPNVIVMRTFSKSYALAGIRIGYAVASKEIIDGLMKLKDSYNADMVAQEIANAALNDREYFKSRISEVKASREYLCNELTQLGFKVVPSSANFLFTHVPEGKAEKLFEFLRDNAVFVRFFDRPETREYLRISIGTREELAILLKLIKEFLKK